MLFRSPSMKNLIFVATILICVAVTALAQPAWQFASKQMLIASGLSVNADRFEVVSADRCEAFELRIWARVFDKNSNLLEADDFVDLKFALRNQTKNDIIALIEYAMSIKPKAHNFEIQKDNFEGYVNRYMNETGG